MNNGKECLVYENTDYIRKRSGIISPTAVSITNLAELMKSEGLTFEICSLREWTAWISKPLAAEFLCIALYKHKIHHYLLVIRMSKYF